jgi:ketose-bisphosphate aldolase
MLTGLKEILDGAEKRGCAIPAFNVYNMETILGVMNAAEETGAPVIFQLYSRLFDGQNACYLAPMLLKVSQSLSTPVTFHLDHGAGDPQVFRALYYGANSIMIDASTLPIEENIKKTKYIVDICNELGVGVEGELGHIGSTSEAQGEYTRVDEVVHFVQKTGVTALAIMVGTAHGRYKQAPVINTKRISEIKTATNIPLVLHGGSGIPDDQIKASIAAGIRKINFGTDLCYSFLDTVFNVSRGIVAIDRFMEEPVKAVKKYAIEKINLLGANGNG